MTTALDEEARALKALAALAQPTRLRLFRLLVVTGAEGLTPGDLMAPMGVAAATLSFHLKELVQAGLVVAQRSSRHIHYRADLQGVNRLLGFLTDHCCGGQPCLTLEAVIQSVPAVIGPSKTDHPPVLP